jgi:hypothetical protein
MTDAEWIERLDAAGAPEPPDWMTPILGTKRNAGGPVPAD